MLDSTSSQLYPPSAGPSAGLVLNPNTLPFKRKVLRGQLEQRRPPLKLTPLRFDHTYRLWHKGNIEGTKPLRQRSFTEFPKYAANLDVSYSDALNFTTLEFEDTLTQTVYEKALEIKENAIALNRLHHDFWLPSPYTIDTDSFDEKCITYVTNFAHIGAKGKSSGWTHAKTLENGFNIKHDPESINKIYNLVCDRLLCPETDLFRIKYTQYGINCAYISAFNDFRDPSKLIYLFHAWQTNYFCPEKQDLEALSARTGKNFVTEEPFLDGWGRLITLYCVRYERLSLAEKAFVKRRNIVSDNDVTLIQPTDQELRKNWRIENEADLLANSDDWRAALPPREANKQYGFHDLPNSHCVYNPANYPSDLFGPPLTAQRPVSTLPYGELYGIL